MVRKSKLLVLAFFLQVFNFSCQNEQSQEQNKKNTIITFFHYWDKSFLTIQSAVNLITRSFNQSANQIQLVSLDLDHESFKTKILSMPDTQSDIYSYWPRAKVQYLVNQNQLYPLDLLFAKEEIRNKFSKQIIQAAVIYNKQYYLAPLTLFYVPFYYNVKLFNRYNLKKPSTWKEFLAVCAKLRQNGVTPIALGAREGWPAQYWFDYLLLRLTGLEYRNKLFAGQVNLTDAPVLKVFSYWKELLEQKYFNSNANELDFSQAAELFSKQQAAMMLIGQFVDGNLRKLGQKEGIDYDFFSFPAIDLAIPKTEIIAIDGLVVAKNSQNPEKAMQVIEYFLKEEVQLLLSAGTGGLCSIKMNSNTVYTPLQAAMQQSIDQAKTLSLSYDVLVPQKVAEVGLDALRQFIGFPDQYEKILQRANEKIHLLIQEKQAN